MGKRILLFAALTSTLALAQTPSTTPTPSPGLDLLAKVSSQYKDAKSFYIESVEERTSTMEYRRDWEKTILIAVGSPENRYHYEGRSAFSNALRISDGTTIWTYHGGDQRYTAKPRLSDKTEGRVMPMTEMALSQAQNLQKKLATLSKPYKSAELLHDSSLKVNGYKVLCYVIRLQSADEKRTSPNYSFEKTIWIDKNRLVVLQIVEHAHSKIQSAGVSQDEDSIQTFSNTVLNGPVPENLFHFEPPPEALLIDDFPDPRTDYAGVGMRGEQAPSLKLKSADGQVVSLDSYRGKPVLIDFWATWCGPCVAGLAKLDKIYHEAGDKGLALISIDRDEEAKTAPDFLAKKGYAWPNFHDDGEIEKIVGSSGIPREMLINAGGKIVYDGSDENALRTEIVKLGPEYASLAPKKQVPCPAAE
jgi:thiol-disulfide isomerase/thioredoxin